jgi:hypothetical protein
MPTHYKRNEDGWDDIPELTPTGIDQTGVSQPEVDEWDDIPDATAPQPPPQPRFQHRPQESPQIFPTGQDHVAREVLGLKPKPYLRSDVLPESHFGILGDVGSGLASGVLTTAETAMRAARALDAPGGVDFIRDATTAGIERIRDWEEEYPRIFKISQQAQDSAVRRAIYGGIQGWVPSLAFGTLGALASTAIGGGPAGTMVGFGLGAGGMFGLAEYDQFMEDAESQGISRSDAFPYAVASALVEGGGEAIADMLAFKWLGPAGAATLPFKGSVKTMMKVGLKPLALAALKLMPIEVGTEMVQGSAETILRNLSGMNAGDPTKAALESIGPAMVMTMLFGASGGVKQGLQMRHARHALEDGTADPTTRQNAANFVTEQLNKVDKDLAELWRFNTDQYIQAGYDIPIDRPTSEYLAWGETSNWSPRLAEELLEGKDIKLLPEGQGFVLIGEAYNPDDRAEYSQYSPEQAEALLEAKNTKLLPDGQGFTVGAGEEQYTVYSPQLAKKLKAEKEKKLLEAPTKEAVTEEVTPVEAAARGVEAAIETGRPEDIAQAGRRLERRVKREGVADRTGALVRTALRATPEATIGEVYRGVKSQVPEATRQEVAKLVRQEQKPDVPLTQKDLKIALKDLGQEEFNHQYNPVNMEAKLVKSLTDRGIEREEAIRRVHPVMVTYEKNYKAVNEKALAARAKEQAKKEKDAEKAKKAAEAVKKLKAKPKAKKAELKAREPKKAAQPLKKKPSAADQVAAMDKPKKEVDWEAKKKTFKKGDRVVTKHGGGVFNGVSNGALLSIDRDEDGGTWAGHKQKYYDVREIELEEGQVVETTVREVPKKLEHKPKRKKTKVVLTKKETDKVVKEAEAKREAKEEEIKPSKLAAGVKVDTPDGKGTIIGSPDKGQWEVRMTSGWARGENLIFGKVEINPVGEKLKAKPKAKLGKVSDVVRKVIQLTRRNDGATVNLVTGDTHRVEHPQLGMKGKPVFAVGVFPGQTTIIEGELTEDHIRGFISQNRGTLGDKRFNIGTWVDSEGRTHIDISVVVKEDWKALDLAKRFGQESIFDMAKEEELYTKGEKRKDKVEFAEVITALAELEVDEPVHLVRYMKKRVSPKDSDIGSIDPADKAHRTDIPGQEKKRLVGDKEAPNRVHYYEEGGRVEPDVARLPHKYRISIPKSRLYDTVGDPLNIRNRAKKKGQAKADPNVAERMMRDAGFWGYQAPSGPFSSIIVMFEQLPVVKVAKAKAETRARSSESIAKEVAAKRATEYKTVIRRSFPTAVSIRPGKFLDDVFHVELPNGSKIQVKVNAMPEDLDVSAFQKDYVRDISDEVPLAIWDPDANVTVTGGGVIWLAGFGDLQTDLDHEVWHAAKDIVLTKAEDKQLLKDYPGEAKDQLEREALAYEEWVTTDRSHKIFDKVRSFFRRVAEQFGIAKGKSYKIFRQVESGKAWHRPFAEVSAKGRLYDAIQSLRAEAPKYKQTETGQFRVFDEALGKYIDVGYKPGPKRDMKHWSNMGAVLYMEGLSGREWTAEMTAMVKEHYGLDSLPQGTVKQIRENAKKTFRSRVKETLTGRLPTIEALVEMEERGVKEGGVVWYDEADGLSTIVENEDGDLEARSARSELEEYFGPDAEFMAGLIAHLSSGMRVPDNVNKAVEVYIGHKLGIDFKGTHMVSKKEISNFLESRRTSGPKRLPFLQAIMGGAEAIVIDRWMARVMNFKSWHNKRKVWIPSTGATEAQRKLLLAWIERGAKRLNITNRAYQAMLWAGKKALDEEASGRPTGTLDPLYKVIDDQIGKISVPTNKIPKGEEDNYYVLPGRKDRAIALNEFMPLKQGNLFAKMGKSETAVEDTLDDIFGSQHKGILQKIKDGWKRMTLRTQILDEFHPILEHLGERTYKLHRMLNGVHASVEAFMRHGKLKLDEDGAIVADGVERGFAVWAKKHGRDAVNVLRWAAAKRSEQLERDNPEWVKNEEFLTESKRQRIYKEIGAGPEGGGTWESLHAEFDEFHQSVLDIAEKAGIIDAQTRKDWGELIYVPFYRVFEDSKTRDEFLANPRKAKDIAAKAKPIKGSKRKIGEPLENVVANWGYMIQESMRNQARAEAYVNGKLMNEVADLIKDIDHQEIKHPTVDKNGVITYETKRGDENVLSFLDKGRRKYFKVNDPELYHALTTMNAQHFGRLFNGFFGFPKRVLTYGATFGPAFRVANAIRDTLHTWMITPGMTFTPFIDTFKGFVSSMREDEHYVAALAAGGLHGGSYVHAEDPAAMHKFTTRLLGKDKDSILLDTGSKVLDFWDKLGAASENAARVQLHRKLLEQGKGTLEAGYQARDLLDFALKGQAKIVLALIRTIPFLGARTQGNYRLARAAFDKNTRATMAIKGMVLAAASLALWSAFKDDDRYKELEDYDKWTYYHFWVGDQHYRMPKPFEVGAIFSSAFESAANTLTDEEEIEFLGRFIEHTFTETFAVGVPQTVKPLAELWANKSFFTGRPIEGKAMQALAPGERAEPWTSETLQLLGKGLNISPKKMEALARGYFATLSAFFLGGTDQVARWVGDFPERPSYRSDDYPLVGRFWRQGPARNTKHATRLYEAMQESDMLVQTVKHYMIEGNMEAAEKLATANLGKFSANKMLNRIRKKLTTLRTAMKDVERSTKLTRQEKRKELDELTVLRNELVKEVYEVYKENLK